MVTDSCNRASLARRHECEPRLRPATDADRDFLCAVFVSTRFDEFARAGWDATRIDALLGEQFLIQDTYYRRHYADMRFDIIELDGVPVGRLYHHWHGDQLSVVDIALLPALRGAGIGTRLMKALVAGAAHCGLATRLAVESENPVQSLYRRLGFVQVGEHGPYHLMRREPAPFLEQVAPLDGL